MIIRMIMMMIIFTITISKRVFLCAWFISTYQMLYGLHWGRQVHCGQQGQQRGQDQGGGWHDPHPVFSKKNLKSVMELSKSIFQVFLTVTHLLDHFWTALDTFGEKNGLKVMSASSLVLSSLLSLPSTMHLPIDTDETGTQEHSNANFYNHYYHYYYCYYYYFLLLTFFWDTLYYNGSVHTEFLPLWFCISRIGSLKLCFL